MMMIERIYLKRLPMIDQEYCNGCRMCAEFCISGGMRVCNGQAFLVHPELCQSDGRCADVCPMGGIRMDWQALEADHAVGEWRLTGSAH